MFALHYRERLASLSQWLANELDQLTASAQARWYPQHDAEGGHTDVTATSVTTPSVEADAVQAGQVVADPGSSSSPAYTFTGTTTTGFYSDGAEYLNLGINGVSAARLYKGTLSGHRWDVVNQAHGTGAVSGNYVVIGRNTSGNGAAGCLALTERDGTVRYLWAEGGTLRIGSAPTEDNSLSHTGGTVVGTQT